MKKVFSLTVFVLLGLLIISNALFVSAKKVTNFNITESTTFNTVAEKASTIDNNFKKTEKEEIFNYEGKDLSNYQYYSKLSKNGLISHRLKFYDFHMVKVAGVYSAVDDAKISSYSVVEDEIKSYSINRISEPSLSFEKKQDENVVASLYSAFDLYHEFSETDELVKREDNSNIDYNYNYNYLPYSISNYTFDVFDLSKKAVDLCPNGCKITLGFVGTYYLVSCKIVEEKNWWGHWYKCSESTDVNFEKVRETNLSLSIVLKRNGDEKFDYYS